MWNQGPKRKKESYPKFGQVREMLRPSSLSNPVGIGTWEQQKKKKGETLLLFYEQRPTFPFRPKGHVFYQYT